jgi:hypothetical protein
MMPQPLRTEQLTQLLDIIYAIGAGLNYSIFGVPINAFLELTKKAAVLVSKSSTHSYSI